MLVGKGSNVRPLGCYSVRNIPTLSCCQKGKNTVRCVVMIESGIEYSDGRRVVKIAPEAAESVCDSVVVVRQCGKLLRWHDAWVASGCPSFAAEEANVTDCLAEALGRFDLAACSTTRWVAKSAIHRGDSRFSGPTRSAHRDLCEVAVANLRTTTGALAFVNVWLPVLRPVDRDPLAFLDPKTADIAAQAAPYRAVSAVDRTGINYDHRHRWFYVPNLRPGDALLWRSDLVYHASFTLPTNPAAPDDKKDQHKNNNNSDDAPFPRRSCDLRFYQYGTAADRSKTE